MKALCKSIASITEDRISETVRRAVWKRDRLL